MGLGLDIASTDVNEDLVGDEISDFLDFIGGLFDCAMLTLVLEFDLVQIERMRCTIDAVGTDSAYSGDCESMLKRVVVLSAAGRRDRGRS